MKSAAGNSRGKKEGWEKNRGRGKHRKMEGARSTMKPVIRFFVLLLSSVDLVQHYVNAM